MNALIEGRESGFSGAEHLWDTSGSDAEHSQRKHPVWHTVSRCISITSFVDAHRPCR